MATNVEWTDLPLVIPRSYTLGRRSGCPKIIVIHYTAGHEGPGDAENGASYDQRRTDGTSTHYHVDSDSVVQCVYTWDEAHAARTRGNDLGIQYELAGTEQSRAQWLDPVSNATITNAARQAARDAIRHKMPIRRLTVAEVRASHPDFGNRPLMGFCGHADITLAFPEDHGDHLDPGTGFPWDVFLARVTAFANGEEVMTDISPADVHAWREARRVQSLTQGLDTVPDSGAPAEVNWAVQTLREILAAVTSPAPLTLTDAQADAFAQKIGDRLVAADTPLGDADRPAIVAAVKQALSEGTD